MKAIGRLFAFYVHGSIHVAISVVALTAITVLEFELSVPSSLWIFVFLAALTGYNFVKYVPPLAHLHPKLTSLYKTIQGFTVVCFLGLLYVSFQIGWSVLLLAAIFGVFTFFYANPLVKHKNLRGMSGIKIFVVALVWGGVTVLIPIIAAGAELNSDVWITFFQRMLLVVVLMIPFELREYVVRFS